MARFCGLHVCVALGGSGVLWKLSDATLAAIKTHARPT